MTFEVLGPKDWKIRGETTMKFQVRMTIEIYIAKELKFKVEMLEQKMKTNTDFLNVLYKDVWKSKKDKRKKM